MNINNRIEKLRKAMKAERIGATIVPMTDPHISEYTPDRYKTLRWITGFTGSAATAVFTAERAGLWTDSRYFLQAEDELAGTGIELFRMGLPETPTVQQWIVSELKQGERVGIESDVFSALEAESLAKCLTENELELDTHFSPWDEIWEDRPPLPTNKAFALDERLTGESVSSKIARVVAELKRAGADSTLLASLDMIAWLFNIRGCDIEYNPVTVAYAYVAEKETTLFIDPAKLPEDVAEHLRREGVRIEDYGNVNDFIAALPKPTVVLTTAAKLNYHLFLLINQFCTLKPIDIHPVDRLKAVKNPIEIAGMRRAMKKDGVALVKFFIDLEKKLTEGQPVTEMDVASMLRKYRSEQALYFSESFSTIAGYAAHGAIVHYSANENSNSLIEPEGLLLIDSGAQYEDGTTDITRTIAVGAVTSCMKDDYTRVLKGNIGLSSASFPMGTVGTQLDVLARQFLWKQGQNYLHGTGHGIGCFLNVHEGPQSIRMNYVPVALEPGMITSNEPGLYKAGEYGIRIENLLLTVADQTTPFGDFYRFETLTLCPIDTSLINKELMNPDEIAWLDRYHAEVYEQLSPELDADEKEWLRDKCKPVAD